MSTVSYIGIGSNVGESVNHVKSAFAALNKIPHTRLINRSSLYETSPHGPVQEQANFINAVAAIETELEPEVLQQYLKQIEHDHHRESTVRWGPRTLDLDLLFYGNETRQTEKLTLPHARVIERLFVLIPLQEVKPKFRLPNGKLIEEQILLLQNDDVDELVEKIPEEGVVSTDNG